MTPPTNPRHNRRKWLDDQRPCFNCGHPRAKHGNIVKRRGAPKTFFCVDWRYLVIISRRVTCGCRIFQAFENIGQPCGGFDCDGQTHVCDDCGQAIQDYYESARPY